MRILLRIARGDWQWIDNFPKIRLLGGEVERDRWLTHARGKWPERDGIFTFSSRLERRKACTYVQALVLYGSSTWARTRDLRINSPALYQLSY